ncbi:hypothetical protein [Deinococcus kurensis]|uniref:hypothetical protein n=1 Tax=Deinococcus kurensis TaxID=2662757 RepID=UPI0012D2B99E|nr:hypothetical protein [Deinococcus kurensis]
MLFPRADFPVVEYGYGVSEGAVCPTCGAGRLFNAENKLRRCDACFTAHPHLQRSLFSPNTNLEQNDLFDQYQSLQRYKVPPVIGEPAVAISDFILDIDRGDLNDAAAAAADAYHVLSAFAPGQVRLFFSGKKGFHLVVPAQVFGFEPSEYLGAVQRRMAASLQQDFGIEVDTTAYSRARLFRTRGSRHTGTGLFRVEIAPDQLADLVSLKEYASAPKGILNVAAPVATPQAAEWYGSHLRDELAFRAAQTRFEDSPSLSASEHHPCFQKLLELGPPAPDTRHRAYVTMVSYCKSAGMTKKETEALLLPWTQQHPLTNTSKSRAHLRLEMSADIRSLYASSRTKFHCQYAMALKVCSKSCPLYVPL